MEAQVESQAEATTAEEAAESEEQARQRRARRAARKGTPALESQDDLGYLTGEHKAGEEDKQIKSPESQRQPGKAKEPAQGESN